MNIFRIRIKTLVSISTCGWNIAYFKMSHADITLFLRRLCFDTACLRGWIQYLWNLHRVIALSERICYVAHQDTKNVQQGV